MEESAVDLYSQVQNENLINLCKPLLNQGWYLDDDGKLKCISRVATDMPWIFARHDDTRRCNLWHSVFFNAFSWLPSPCLECWKVVVRPQNLRDLFELRQVQRELELPSKCGIELRQSVFGLYGGYFYCDSKEQGAQVWKLVRDYMDSRMMQYADVILKRGCTEFEHYFGDSAKWEDHVTDAQIHQEKKLASFIETKERVEQPQIVKDSIYKKWIEFAFASGDPTYKMFTNHKSLYPAYTTYHQELEFDYFAANDANAEVAEVENDGRK